MSDLSLMMDLIMDVIMVVMMEEIKDVMMVAMFTICIPYDYKHILA